MGRDDARTRTTPASNSALTSRRCWRSTATTCGTPTPPPWRPRRRTWWSRRTASGCGCVTAVVRCARSSTRCRRGGARSTGTPFPSSTRRPARQLDSMAHVMFGGLTHEPAIGLGPPARRPRPRRPRARLPRRLGVGVGRGRDEDGAAVAPRGRSADAPGSSRSAAATTATRSRRCRSPTRWAGCTPCSAGCCPSTCSRRGRPAVWTAQPTTPSWSPGSARPGRCTPRTPTRVAAVIVEPVLQGAGGMHVYSPHVLAVLHDLARGHGALVIHDEIATGLAAHGSALGRRGAGRPGPRRPVRRQGPDRRLPDPRGGAVHRPRSRRGSAPARRAG